MAAGHATTTRDHDRGGQGLAGVGGDWQGRAGFWEGRGRSHAGSEVDEQGLYRHCKCGDLLQEATGDGEEETEPSQRGKKNLDRVKTRKVVVKTAKVGRPMASGSSPPGLTWRAS